MEQFSAAAVYEMARTFEQLRATCNLIERFGKVKFSGSEIVPDQMESIELLPARTRMELPPEWQKSVLKILTAVEQHCEYIGLKLSTQAARDARVELESGRIKTYSDASEAFRGYTSASREGLQCSSSSSRPGRFCSNGNASTSSASSIRSARRFQRSPGLKRGRWQLENIFAGQNAAWQADRNK